MAEQWGEFSSWHGLKNSKYCLDYFCTSSRMFSSIEETVNNELKKGTFTITLFFCSGRNKRYVNVEMRVRRKSIKKFFLKKNCTFSYQKHVPKCTHTMSGLWDWWTLMHDIHHGCKMQICPHNIIAKNIIKWW